jgi:hypothetical protein
MLGWLFPSSCPCDPAAKEWVEERLAWLADEFDDHAFNGRRIVLPTRDFFPDPYDSSPDAVRTLLDRVCGYMDVVPELVSLWFKSDEGRLGMVNEDGYGVGYAAGTYQEGEGEFVVTREEYDNELLTDLTTVHFGLGLFTANKPAHFVPTKKQWPGSTLNKPEYMTPPMYGWALAHLAWFRGEDNPAWAKHLSFYPRGEFKQGLRYLTKTGDSAYKPVRMR